MANLKILTVSSIKGGVGKTVSSVNISTCIAAAHPEVNVILLDLDPSGNASLYLRYPPDAIDVGSKEIFDEDYTFKECINSTFMDNLFIIPAEISMRNIEVMIGLGEIKYDNQNSLLKDKIDEYRDDIEKDTYIIIDTHPDFNLFTLNALMCSDRVLCPIEHCNFSFHGFELLLNTVNNIREKFNKKLRVLGLFRSNWDKANSIAVKTLEENLGAYDKYMLDSTITSSIIVEESKLKMTPLVILNPKHQVSKGYIELAEELISRWDKIIR